MEKTNEIHNQINNRKMTKSDDISIKLLLIEDSENDAFILIRHLKKEGINVEYDRVYSENAVKEALKNKKWDIVISDYAMPGFDGEEALKIFNEMDIEIPFIMISGTIGEDVAVKSMKNGAHDYMMKDNLTRLVPAIKRELIEAKNRMEKKQHEIVHEIIYNITNKANISVSSEELYNTIELELRKIIDTTNLFVGLYNSKTKKLSFPYVKDKKDKFLELPVENTLSAIVLEKNKALLLGDKEIKQLESKNIICKIGSHSKSWLGVPLSINNKAIGLIVVQDYENNNAFNKNDVRLLEFISDQIAISIQKKKSEEQIRKLSLSVEQSPVSVVITDINGNIEYVNPKFTEVTGYSYDEAIGENPRILKSGLQADEFYKILWKTISSGKEWHGEFHNKRKSGELFWESVSISPIKNESGKITHFVAVKEDITEKKKNLAELVIAKERAEESDRLKSSFLATMSHELRTPLNSIIGFAELIANDIFSYEDVVENSKLIYQSGHNLLSLINDMFDFSLIETGEIKINKTEVSINKILDKLEIDFSRDKKVRTGVIKLIFEKDFEYEKDKLDTDNIKFRQVFSNLIGNALKFTEKGLVKSGYKVIKDDKGNDFVEFFVKDTGIGISEKMQDLIFDRFRQVEETHIRRFGGAGLGLSISKRLVELLGGKIRVESQVGKGSIFYFTLPFDRKLIKEKLKKEFVADKKSYNWSEKKILVVEDVQSNYKLVEMILRKTNAKVIRAVNGFEAIEICKSDKNINLVIMDIRLPDLSGYDATKKIKEMHPDLPVLAQTSCALSGDREISLQAGCDDYISKPLDKSLFLSKINVLLKKKTLNKQHSTTKRSPYG